MTSILGKRENLETDKHTDTAPCEEEARNQGDTSIRQGMPKTASKPFIARVDIRNRFFLTALRTNPDDSLILDFQPPKL